MIEERSRTRVVAAFVGAVGIAGASLFAVLVHLDLRHGLDHMNWVAFSLFSILLFLV